MEQEIYKCDGCGEIAVSDEELFFHSVYINEGTMVGNCGKFNHI